MRHSGRSDHMITTLTPNPSLDRTMLVGAVVPGSGHVAERSWTEPAGKGVNISRALAVNGFPTRVIIPAGGANGAELERLLGLDGIDYASIPIAGSVRSNISVIEPDGRVTKFNEQGPELSDTEVTELIEQTVSSSAPGDWVAACGSLPPGVGSDFYALLAGRLREAGALVAVDTSGHPLADALVGRPNVIKPNRHELADLVGSDISTLGEAVAAAQELLALGSEHVLVSLGPDGALLVGERSVTHGEARVSQVQNTVGAGDALLAGFLAAGAAGPTSLREALAWASAAIRSPQTSMTSIQDLDRDVVTIHDSIDESRILADESSSLSSVAESGS